LHVRPRVTAGHKWEADDKKKAFHRQILSAASANSAVGHHLEQAAPFAPAPASPSGSQEWDGCEVAACKRQRQMNCKGGARVHGYRERGNRGAHQIGVESRDRPRSTALALPLCSYRCIRIS
jgi:hypothetical protein